MASTSMTPPSHAPAFLSEHGWGGAEILPLAGDASFRRYFRVRDGDRVAVLMDAPPPHEDPRPFVAMADWLCGLGLSAPEVLARDFDQGLLLLSDLGNDRFREHVDARPEREGELYEAATDLLVELHRHPPMPGLPPHGLAEWLTEVELFIDWYCPAVGIVPQRAEFRRAWEQVLGPIASDGAGPVTVLRDYHAENIMLVDGRQGVCHLGLLDFQDALAGHPAYDLCSVLEDARRDVSPGTERAMIERYKTRSGAAGSFDHAYWALAAQRNTRILGVFTRLWKRDGKPGYRRFQPRMWGLLERDLAQPGLEPVRDWFAAHVPDQFRAAPWLEDA